MMFPLYLCIAVDKKNNPFANEIALVSKASPNFQEQQSPGLQLPDAKRVLAVLGDAELAKSLGGGWLIEALDLLNCLVSGTFVFIIQRFLPVP